MRATKKQILGFFSALAMSGLVTISPAHADAGFQKWIRDFKGTAVKNGVSSKFYDRAFANVNTPDADVLKKARFQPEFKDQAWQYIDSRVNERTVANGQKMDVNTSACLIKLNAIQA